MSKKAKKATQNQIEFKYSIETFITTFLTRKYEVRKVVIKVSIEYLNSI